MFLKLSPCAANTEFAIVEQLLVFVISGALVFTVERGRKKNTLRIGVVEHACHAKDYCSVVINSKL